MNGPLLTETTEEYRARVGADRGRWMIAIFAVAGAIALSVAALLANG